MNEQEFFDACSKIDTNAVALEVFDWLLNNINDYVDNADTAYLLYFSGDILEGMPQMGALWNVYKNIPEGNEEDLESQAIEERCILEYEKIITVISDLIKNNKEKLAELFEKLIFFYDTKIMTDGKNIVPFTEKLDGHIDMGGLIFEPFPVEMEVKRKDVTVDKNTGREVGSAKSKVIKKITIEPGFCVQFDIVYWRPAGGLSFSMF